MCNGKAQFKGGVLYWLLYVPFLLILPLVLLFAGLLIYALTFPETLGDDLVWLLGSPWFLAIFVLWLLLIPLDKLFDGRFRKLQPLVDKDGAV